MLESFGTAERKPLVQTKSRFWKATTKLECMIYLDEPAKGTVNAILPCYHVVSGDGLLHHAKASLKKGCWEIACPAAGCFVGLNHQAVREICRFTKDDESTYQILVGATYLDKKIGARACPGCGWGMTKDSKVRSNRVRCPK